MTDIKETAKQVFLKTLETIEPASVISNKLRLDGEDLLFGSERLSLNEFREVVLIGMGKASLKMGHAVESLLGDRVKRGLLVTDRQSGMRVRSEVILGGHPLPDANSLVAGEKIVDLVRSCGSETLVMLLISGGGSALAELPISRSISLEELRVTNQVLIGCGATIHEINLIRKSLSQIKGGGIGRLARNSKCVGLYISDVNPGDLRAIASNPLLPEEVRQEDCLEVVKRFDLVEKLPSAVLDVLQRRSCGLIPFESAGSESQPLRMLLLDNSDAIQAAAEQARLMGFRVEVRADLIEGDYRTIADELIGDLLNLKSSYPDERVCVISGGEVSCPVRSGGIGGRNQEFVLYSATRLSRFGVREGAAVLSCGTDGMDGNSSAAGAVADADLVINAAQHDIDASIFLSGNDSHSFFRKVGGLVMTGPSGNNVRDLRILMAQ